MTRVSDTPQFARAASDAGGLPFIALSLLQGKEARDLLEQTAAPLAARGAKVAVLMGAAYLFTREAVEAGAIVPGFQQAALACSEAVLLETAPGHATRAVATEYVRHFARVRSELQQAGRPAQEIWAELEALNLGRLRIASKGIVRRGDERVSVDEPAQQREGLYMIGQVAACIRSSRRWSGCTRKSACMARVGSRASCRTRWVAAPAGTPEIAIVGMACMFPNAPDLDAFFRNVLANADCITEVPEHRWKTDTYFDPRGRPDSTPSMWGGFLPEQRFRPAEFGIPPRSLASTDPAQLLTLLVAKRALADAGLTPETMDGERTSVIIGAEAGADLAAAYTLRAY